MIQHITKPFKYFFKLEAASGLILLFAAILALIISNGNLADLYFTTLDKYLILGTKLDFYFEIIKQLLIITKHQNLLELRYT